MANNTPHVPVAREPADHSAVSANESERSRENAPVSGMPVSDGQCATPASAGPLQAVPANTNPAHANPANAKAAEAARSPSSSNALWLVITLINVILIVFIIPAGLLKNEQLGFIVKAISIIGAMGAFAAGLVWFKNLMATLPQRKWFKVINVSLLCLVIPGHVSQMPVVRVHPRIEPAGSKLEIGGQPRDYESGTVWLAIRNHIVRVTPRGDGRAGNFAVSYKDMFFAIFREYKPRWTPLYVVEIGTKDPDIEVLIRMKDGVFDPGFRKDPPATGLELTFVPKPDSNDTFVYRGANLSTGSGDYVDLPYGEYELIAHKEGCKQSVKQLSVGKTPEAKANFDRLCQNGQ